MVSSLNDVGNRSLLEIGGDVTHFGRTGEQLHRTLLPIYDFVLIKRVTHSFDSVIVVVLHTVNELPYKTLSYLYHQQYSLTC